MGTLPRFVLARSGLAESVEISSGSLDIGPRSGSLGIGVFVCVKVGSCSVESASGCVESDSGCAVNASDGLRCIGGGCGETSERVSSETDNFSSEKDSSGVWLESFSKGRAVGIDT